MEDEPKIVKNINRTLTVGDKNIQLKTDQEREAELELAKAELAQKLSAGKISGAEYNQKVMDLMVPAQINEKVFRKNKKLAPPIILLVSISLAIIIGGAYVGWRFYFQNTLTASGLLDYSNFMTARSDEEPIQIPTNKTEIGEYKNREIQITYKDYYDISGVVTSVHDYWGFDDYATLVPRDVCIVWGSSLEAYLEGIAEFSQRKRGCFTKVDTSWLDVSELTLHRSSFGKKYVSVSSVSNNHLIPSTPEIRGQIFGLSSGDNVRIVGYLVNVTYGDIHLSSSETRTDTGNGACEVIYVTKVEKF